MNELSFPPSTLPVETTSIMAGTRWAQPELVERARRDDPSGLLCAFHNPDRPAVVDWPLVENRHAAAHAALQSAWYSISDTVCYNGACSEPSNDSKSRAGSSATHFPIYAPAVDVRRGCVVKSVPATRWLSWTLDRRVVAFFCIYHARGSRVLRRIRRTSILMHHLADRHEGKFW